MFFFQATNFPWSINAESSTSTSQCIPGHKHTKRSKQSIHHRGVSQTVLTNWSLLHLQFSSKSAACRGIAQTCLFRRVYRRKKPDQVAEFCSHLHSSISLTWLMCSSTLPPPPRLSGVKDWTNLNTSLVNPSVGYVFLIIFNNCSSNEV